MDAPHPLSSANKLIEEDLFGPLRAKTVAALLAVVFCGTFYTFRSNTLIGDGLRHLPALRTITGQAPLVYMPKPWLETYRAQYDRVVVHNHFLFALVMRTAFALQRAVGVKGDVIIAMQAVNAVSAAIAGALFFLLALRMGVPKWIALAVAAGFCLSPAYLQAGTNIDEVALSLPFFLGTLLVLSNPEFQDRDALAAGVLAGMAGILYLLAGALIPCIAVALMVSQPRSRPKARVVLVFLSVFALIFLGIWVAVLFISGVHDPADLARAIVRLPQQGTYGGFRLSSLIATPIGLAQALFTVLPADFRGLRSLADKPAAAMYVGVLTLLTCAFLARAIWLLYQRRALKELLFLSSLLTFLLVEAACIEWDPFYQKLQIFGLITFWVIVAAGFAGVQNDRTYRWLLLLFVAAVVFNGLWILRKNVQPSLARENAQRLHSIVGAGVFITGWSSDAAHMWLYSNGENLITIPEFAMDRDLQANRVMGDLNGKMKRAAAEGEGVYFYDVFDSDDANLINVFETRFRLTGFVPYLRSLQRKCRQVATFEQPGGQEIVLYAYSQ
jgi:hypothetical protein